MSVGTGLGEWRGVVAALTYGLLFFFYFFLVAGIDRSLKREELGLLVSRTALSNDLFPSP